MRPSRPHRGPDRGWPRCGAGWRLRRGERNARQWQGRGHGAGSALQSQAGPSGSRHGPAICGARWSRRCNPARRTRWPVAGSLQKTACQTSRAGPPSQRLRPAPSRYPSHASEKRHHACAHSRLGPRLRATSLRHSGHAVSGHPRRWRRRLSPSRSRLARSGRWSRQRPRSHRWHCHRPPACAVRPGLPGVAKWPPHCAQTQACARWDRGCSSRRRSCRVVPPETARRVVGRIRVQRINRSAASYFSTPIVPRDRANPWTPDQNGRMRKEYRHVGRDPTPEADRRRPCAGRRPLLP